MASKREQFSHVRPVHLTSIDWKNQQHRRSVAACLVHGAYVLERDRQEEREGSLALAPPWWEFFQFHLLERLVDKVDSSVCGAIYEYKAPPSLGGRSLNEPHYVVAFRGNMFEDKSINQDLKLDLQFIRHGLHQTSRFKTSMQAVRDMFGTTGDTRVWIAGHSLGAAIAMLIGKTMAKQANFSSPFFFNPPYFSAPIEQIKNEKLKHGIRFISSYITAGLSIAIKGLEVTNRSQDPFSAIAKWVPNLYVNPADHICSEYINYFEHRIKMQEIGAKGVEKLSTQHSISGLIMTAMGKEAEPVYLIPSAFLTVNLTPCLDFVNAHEIYQWWKPNLNLQSKLYKYC